MYYVCDASSGAVRMRTSNENAIDAGDVYHSTSVNSRRTSITSKLPSG